MKPDSPDQPPDPFKDLAEVMEGMAALAAFNRSSYTAHLEQGFTEEEAFTLTIEVMRVQLTAAWKS